jgi:hypothetical protein
VFGVQVTPGSGFGDEFVDGVEVDGVKVASDQLVCCLVSGVVLLI